MPRIKLTKSSIDALPTAARELVYWDVACPGFGVKVTPKSRKVFVILYRTSGARLRKFTIGPYGRVTLHQARLAAQKVFAAKLEGRDPAGERRDAKRREVVDRVTDVLESFIAQYVSQRRSAGEITRLLRREVGGSWGTKSIHQITKRDVVDLVSAVEQRGAPIAANKTLKTLKTFLRWCVGKAILERSPAEGIPLPAKEVARDRVLTDLELAKVLLAARKMEGPYGYIVELLALSGQRREEVAQMRWEEVNLNQRTWILSKARTKNGKEHIVHLSGQAVDVLERVGRQPGGLVFPASSGRPFCQFGWAKKILDDRSGATSWRLHDLRRTCVSGMARLGIAPHVADKVLNHQSGTISGVAAVYQRHDFLAERRDALDQWGKYVEQLLTEAAAHDLPNLRKVA